jgi:hypothetical protein
MLNAKAVSSVAITLLSTLKPLPTGLSLVPKLAFIMFVVDVETVLLFMRISKLLNYFLPRYFGVRKDQTLQLPSVFY